MSTWDTCFSRRVPSVKRVAACCVRMPAKSPCGFRLLVLAVACIAVSLVPGRTQAQALLTQQEALRLAFPEPLTIERHTAFLGPREIARASELAGRGVDVKEGVITYYVGLRAGVPVGAAYFDVHRVRTLPEVVMIVVARDERIARIEILKFAEPPQYLAPAGWLRQIEGKRLSEELSLRRGIVNMTGATLTSEAVTAASRRVLALHKVIDPFRANPAAVK